MSAEKKCNVCGVKESWACEKYKRGKTDPCPRDKLPDGYDWRTDNDRRMGKAIVNEALTGRTRKP